MVTMAQVTHEINQMQMDAKKEQEKRIGQLEKQLDDKLTHHTRVLGDALVEQIGNLMKAHMAPATRPSASPDLIDLNYSPGTSTPARQVHFKPIATPTSTSTVILMTPTMSHLSPIPPSTTPVAIPPAAIPPSTTTITSMATTTTSTPLYATVTATVPAAGYKDNAMGI